MKTCIICRKSKEDNQFNDEHVIPDSIGGYYHIYTVCINCNSRLGSTIDGALTNHKFIEFQRHLLGLKGKSGRVPNPFAGTHFLKDDPDQKVQLVLNEEGGFVPRLIPNVPKELPPVGTPFSIVIDKKDESKSNEIIDKFLSRNGISRDNIKLETKTDSSYPWIQARMVFDLHNFKLSILKIAYEFATDKIPEYLNDPLAIKISEILSNAKYDELGNLKIIGDGLEKKILQPFEHLLDFKVDNHYLILMNSKEYGLLCFINLFNTMVLGFIMSEKTEYYLKDDFMLVAKNSIADHNVKFFTLSQLVANVYTPMEYKFQYIIPDIISVHEFMANDRHPNFSFYHEENQIPFFDATGNIKYPSIDSKLKQKQLGIEDKGDFTSEIRTEIQLDEELYIKLLPINKLYRVNVVQLIQYHRSKV